MLDQLCVVDMLLDVVFVMRFIINSNFDYFMENPGKMRGTLCPASSGQWEDLETAQLARCVCDYIAGMTDRFASQTFADIFLPTSWRGV